MKTSFLWILRIFLCALFLFSAGGKFLNLSAFWGDLESYLIFPQWLMAFALYAVPSFELVCALALLTPLYRAGAFYISGLLLVFIAVLTIVWAKGIDISCGCFGGEGVGNVPWVIVRDMALLVVAAIVLFSKRKAAQ